MANTVFDDGTAAKNKYFGADEIQLTGSMATIADNGSQSRHASNKLSIASEAALTKKVNLVLRDGRVTPDKIMQQVNNSLNQLKKPQQLQ